MPPLQASSWHPPTSCRLPTRPPPHLPLCRLYGCKNLPLFGPTAGYLGAGNRVGDGVSGWEGHCQVASAAAGAEQHQDDAPPSEQHAPTDASDNKLIVSRRRFALGPNLPRMASSRTRAYPPRTIQPSKFVFPGPEDHTCPQYRTGPTHSSKPNNPLSRRRRRLRIRRAFPVRGGAGAWGRLVAK
uniref:Uncharacterized protein n=1 Tax=Mycena chlorophos TaxID=658473 RepID=A0ABQ0KUU4_MYCCL|nr:predicted protein [Mycena chlorophos]